MFRKVENCQGEMIIERAVVLYESAIKARNRQIYSNINGILEKMIGAALFAFFVASCICIVYQLYFKIKKREKRNKEIVLLISYLSFLAYMTVISRTKGTMREIDLVPFDTFGGTHLIILYALANLVVFIPLGVIVAKMWKKKHLLVFSFSVGIIVSFSIEALQLLLKCGFFQLEDIIMNCLGTMLGTIIYLLFSRLMNKCVCGANDDKKISV